MTFWTWRKHLGISSTCVKKVLVKIMLKPKKKKDEREEGDTTKKRRKRRDGIHDTTNKSNTVEAFYDVKPEQNVIGEFRKNKRKKSSAVEVDALPVRKKRRR